MGITSTLVDSPLKAFVDANMHRPGAVGTGGRDFHLQPFVSKAPLHEGRSKRVFRSSPKDPLSGVEPEPVGCAVAGDWKSPAHGSTAVADQKEQVLFQFFDQATHELRLQGERLCYLLDTQRPPAISRQLPDRKISDGMMGRRHERQKVVHMTLLYNGTSIPRYTLLDSCFGACKRPNERLR